MSSNVDYFTKKENISEEVVGTQEAQETELSEAVLKVSYFTGKVKDNKTAEKLGIKIRVDSPANPGNNVIFSGDEESLKKYAVKYLGADKGDTLSQIQSYVESVGELNRFESSYDWTSKINEKVEEYIQEGSCSSKKKLHANYNEEDSEYQEFFKKALEKFGVESPDELDDEKKKEFFDYVDANWKADGEVKESLVDKIKDQLANLKKKKDAGNSEMDDATIMKLASLLQKKGQLAQKMEQHEMAARRAADNDDDDKADEEQEKWEDANFAMERIDDEIRDLKAKDRERR
jgi:hypothetical protein